LKSRTNTKSRTIGSVARGILAVFFFVIAGWLWLNQQLVLDQIAVWQYKPAPEVVALADRASMNDRGRFLFYTGQPIIEGTQQFNQECDRKEEGVAILGCYVADKIFIYDVKDSRLDGIREVTAAHEMLHVAYQRLGGAEREKIDRLLEAEYAKLSEKDKFKDRMAFYARTEPGERDNELHSVIGTEVADLDPELEAYYKTFFFDRSKIVALHDVYQSVFLKIENQAKEIYAELTALGKKIEVKSNEYNGAVSSLNDDIQSFNERARNNRFSSQSQFTTERTALSNRVDSITAMREQVNKDIAVYEELRARYNQTASESKRLNDSLDSSLAPAPSI